MYRTVFSLVFAFAALGCGNGDNAATGAAPSVAAPYAFTDATLFPPDRTLTHAEDGVVLSDGSVLVGDWDHGLVVLAPDGTHRAFGDFAAAGFKSKPAPDWNSPNGISLEPDGAHALVADITSGHIYRVNVTSEAVTRIYDHPFGVNNVVRDPSGAIWFTQSTTNTEGEGSEARMFAAADRPLTDGAVFRIAPEQISAGEIQPERVIDGMAFANGIAFDAARNRLYVAELMAHRVLSFDVDAGTGALSNRQTLVEVVTPDNIELDEGGALWIASPAANAVYIADPETGAMRTFFEPSPETSRALVAQVRQRAENGEGILDLIGPEMFEPMPGLLTGVILSPDGGPVYVSGLGDALVKIDRE
ncbi:SMP-30/gluconolactonase/LRE family protein [Marinicaulis aureus]|uniref:SMP-30/gluconolactonase/LRE family protein n=1 Tax=Hyphococcus aureus TaxID=2666033 RepID=A0ABW1KZ73_9PROT